MTTIKPLQGQRRADPKMKTKFILKNVELLSFLEEKNVARANVAEVLSLTH
ncbi:hypothetical protein Syun_023996 [Stephania yunnanensis]|uniref:Uncharacterized protein n=1 Tax=Stephania yunnanensis TaxID=152371 RepID=A0AAP0I3R7_9MAGN